jgi:hypothetical protein
LLNLDLDFVDFSLLFLGIPTPLCPSTGCSSCHLVVAFFFLDPFFVRAVLQTVQDQWLLHIIFSKLIGRVCFYLPMEGTRAVGHVCVCGAALSCDTAAAETLSTASKHSRSVANHGLRPPPGSIWSGAGSIWLAGPLR